MNKKGGANTPVPNTPPKTGFMDSFFSFFNSKPIDNSKIERFLEQPQPTNFKSDVFPDKLSKEGKIKYNAPHREIPSTKQTSNPLQGSSGGAHKSLRRTKRQKLKKRKTRRHI